MKNEAFLKELNAIKDMALTNHPALHILDLQQFDEFHVYAIQMATIDICINFMVFVVDISKNEVIWAHRHRVTHDLMLVSQDPEATTKKYLGDMRDKAIKYIEREHLVDRILLED